MLEETVAQVNAHPNSGELHEEIQVVLVNRFEKCFINQQRADVRSQVVVVKLVKPVSYEVEIL